jgi:large subunit ribosomal protein L13
METIVLDGKGAIFGRMATVAAKELLKGNAVHVINCEQIIISGDKPSFVKWIIQKRSMGRGGSLKGPLYIRREDLLVKRMIRGMLPYDRPKGQTVFKNLKCHIGKGDVTEALALKARTFEHSVSKSFFTIKDVLGSLR